ncbi:MAG: response regulator transcription factor [Prevotellaceae bacterium]|jgi:DNA-binding response OmpR family regulator|nr:response regulator transcription factor [Prevotellaceae bacterium]
MKILIVEDDASLSEIIQQSLEKERFVVEAARDYAAAIDKTTLYNYDCILLDIMLPDGNGLDLLKHLKNAGKQNIIIISAKDSIDDKIAGLNIGADDYLPKPFHLAELNARIRSVVRRNNHSGSNIIVSGNINLNTNDRTVFIDGKNVELNRKEFDILFYCINRSNRLLTKEHLAEAVWGDNIDQADNFDFIYAQVKNLRKKLVSAKATPKIKAVYGIGYRFIVE